MKMTSTTITSSSSNNSSSGSGFVNNNNDVESNGIGVKAKEIETIAKFLQNIKNSPNLIGGNGGPNEDQLRKDIEMIINVLQCPVFGSIVTVKESLDKLKSELIKHPSILPLDFDIVSETGQLILNIPTGGNPNGGASTSSSVNDTNGDGKRLVPF